MSLLSPEQIMELKQFDSPTVCNAIEWFGLRSRIEGFADSSIRSIFPEREPLVGYACTARISSIHPATSEQKELLYAYYQSLIESPRPSIAVIEDIDAHPVGSFWGEVQATTHLALGCSGTITNGGIRDLDEMYELGMTVLASTILVSHGFIHVEEAGGPVTIGGLRVEHGDLLHADKHGVVKIPASISHELAEACRLMQRAEKPLLDGCRNRGDGAVNVEDIRKLRNEMDALRRK